MLHSENEVGVGDVVVSITDMRKGVFGNVMRTAEGSKAAVKNFYSPFILCIGGSKVRHLHISNVS